MFKFNFSGQVAESCIEEPNSHCEWQKSREILQKDATIDANYVTNSLQCDNYMIKYISSLQVIDLIKSSQNEERNPVLSADQSHSDLITGVYEGGLKVWECTFDLCNFMCNDKLEFSGKEVLDLGCGAGIVGILAGIKGATCCFQDYNSEVVTNLTIPNVILNGLEGDKHEYYCGDWESFSSNLQIKGKKFDYIFTSETIYNVENYRKLVNVFKNLLKITGTIFLAAKYFYFGVGGGVSQFLDLLSAEEVFEYSTCWDCQEGVKRAVIKINFKC